ncbi:YadA-like family protein [Xanthomonas sacchari]|uniref:YadA-like family protein n=2 Tax=Xanthomonas TaxID=338 RepID=UPI0024354E13|nr:YadA-like family protein [Xanthomonas sacchari]
MTFAQNSVAIGSSAKVNGASNAVSDASVAIGAGATVGSNAANSIALGGGQVVSGAKNAIAQGNGANAANANAIAIGHGATTGTTAPTVGTTDTSGIAIGGGAWSNWGVAIGDQAKTSTSGYGVSIGRQTSTGLRATALGFTSAASGTGSVAIGDSSQAQSDQSVAIGSQATAKGGKAVSIGAGNTANGDGAVAIGDPNNATGAGAVAQGKDNTANGDGAVAIGNTNDAEGQGSVALGIKSSTTSAGGVALGDTAAAKARNAMALGSNAVANNANDVALGAGSTTGAASSPSSGTIDGTTYQYAGVNPGSVVSVGSQGNERQITNVAAGNLSGSSTDAVNGSQLFATNQAVNGVGKRVDQLGNSAASVLGGNAAYDQATGKLSMSNVGGTGENNVNDAIASVAATANTGWNVQANGDTATQVKPGDTVQFKDGQNIKITRNGADITVATADDLNATSLTTGNSKLDTNGLTIANGPSVLASGIDAGGKKITNVAAGDVSSSSTDAINGSQLNTTNQNLNTVASNTSKYLGGGADVANGTAPSYSVGGSTYNNAGDAFSAIDSGKSGVVQRTSTADVTTLVASGGTAANPGNAQKLTNLAAGDLSSSSTDAVNGSQLYAVQQTANAGWNVQANGDTATQVKPGDTVQFKDGQNIKVTRNGTDITVATADDLNANSITTGNSKLDTNGLTIANGPSVLASGIDAGGKKITSVAAGDVSSSSTDAINGSQLYTTNQNLSTVAANTSKYLGGGADVQNGTAPSYSVGGSTYNNAGDAFAAVDSGKSGVVQRTSTADVTTMVASGGTAANPGNAQKLTNLAAGDVTSSSKDAVNGSQLYAVQQTANAGWNVQANGDTATQVKPGDTVQFKDGQNVKVTRNGTDVTVATADDLNATSITTGNSKLDTNGLAIANGPSVLASGIDAGSKKITSVADGDLSSSSKDAVNGSQLYATNQQVSNISNGSAGVVQRTSTTDVTTLTASGGTAANPGNAQKLTNLAAGTLSGTSTDAVNGSQLYAVQQTANAGWNVQANGDTATQVKPGDTVQFKDGQNIKVTRNGADITVATADDLNATSITTGNSKLDTNGLAIANGPSVLASGIDAGGKKITSVAAGDVSATSTDAINGSQLNTTNQNLSTVASNTSKYLGGGADVQNGTAPSYSVGGSTYNNAGDAFAAVDSGKSGVVQRTSTADVTTMVASGGTAANPGNAQKLTNLAAGDVTSSSKDAVNGSQLYAVQQTANAGWNVQANGDTATQVKPGDTVQFKDGQNIKVTRNGTDITVATADDLTANSLTAGNSKLDTNGLKVDDGTNSATYAANGLTIANGPSVLASGIDAGGKKITSVAAGDVSATSTDAINGSQLNTTNQNLSTVASNTSKYLGGGADVQNGTAPSYSIGGTTYNNAGDAFSAVDSGKAGVVQRTSTADVTTMVASGATAANPGNAQKLTNLAAGTLSGTSTDAVNGSQLYAAGSSAASVLGGNAAYNTTTGTLGMSNVGGTGKDNVNDAIASVAATAGTGWNVQANGDTATQVKPGDTVQFKDGQNIKVTRNGTDITVATADDLNATSITTGNSRLDTNGLKVDDGTNATAYAANGMTIANGPSVTGNGIDAGGKKITSVAAGDLSSSSTDAVNGSQLYTTNQNLSTVASNTSKYLGGGADVQNGTAPSYSIGGTTYNNAGDAFSAVDSGKAGVVQRTSTADVTTMVASGGTAANPGNAQKLTNLAAGTLSGTSTDAVNGAQLYAVQQTANAGWNVQANGDTATQVKPGDTVQFKDGQNIKVTRNGTDVTVATADDLSATSLTTGNSRLDTSGLKVDDGTNSTTYAASGMTIANGPSVTINGIDAGGKKITRVAAGDLSSTSTDAINGAQLYAMGNSAVAVLGGNAAYDTATGRISMSNVGGTGKDTVNDAIASVAATAGTGWNVQANGDTATQVKPGDTVQFKDGQNIKVTRNGTDITVATADDLNAVSLTTGNARLDTNGLSVGSNVSLGASGLVIVNGPSVTSSGIDAGGQRITNVAAGVAGTDAVNVSQLTQATSGAANRWVTGSQTTSYVAPSATGTESTAVGSGASASGSNTVAVGTGAAASTANSVALGNGSTTTAAVATTGTTLRGQTYAFAGSAPVGVVSVGSAGSERQIQNVAAGQLSASSTDAVNGSQLYATNQAIESVRATAGAGFNVTTAATGSGVAVGSSVARVSPGSTVTYTAGNNMTLTQNGTDITYALSENLSLNSITVGNTTVANNGVSIAGGPSMTTTGIDAGGRPVTNVAPGVAGTDAVNVDQLNHGIASANRYTDQAVATVRKDANAGTAAALATANLPQAFMPGRGMTSVALGSYQGQSAIAVGVSALSDNARWVFKLSGSATTRGNVGVGAGVGFQW